MDASHKIQRGIHAHLIQFLMYPEFWVHITPCLRFFCEYRFFICYRIQFHANPFRLLAIQIVFFSILSRKFLNSRILLFTGSVFKKD